ncbi:MAG TPA: hypothetical protein VGQ31_02350 [Candidatus Limnocylindrales bacterium]|jgi:hypothetical protein|nr:hypothetical protein [Candidatus Limnocylindrales bacterium]
MFDLNLHYVAQAERERRIETDLRRRAILEAATAATAHDKPAQVRPTERRQGLGPVRAFGR